MTKINQINFLLVKAAILFALFAAVVFASEDEHDHEHDSHDEEHDSHEDHDSHEEHDSHEDHDSHDDESSSTPWGEAIGASIVVNIAALVGVITLIPLFVKAQERKDISKYFNIGIPAFAVGALLSVSLLFCI